MKQVYVYVSCGEGREIDVFALDSASGALELRQRVVTGGMAVPMRLRADMCRLYVGLRGERALGVFAIDPQSGVLKSLGKVAAPGEPVYVYCDTALRTAYAASYGDNNLAVFPLDTSGVPGPAMQTETGLPHAHAARLDASGRWLAVPMLGADTIRVYPIGGDGRIAGEAVDHKVVNGAGPRHPLFSADNRFVYCLNELNGCIDVFAFDAVTGGLQPLQTVDMMPSRATGTPWAAELRITPDGRHLYASDRRTHCIAAFAVDAECGHLSLVGHFTAETQPRGMDIDSAGRWLVVAGQQSSALAVLRIDPRTGRLTQCHTHRTGRDPICVEIGAW